MIAAIFCAIGGIAIAAILCAMYLLDQRSKLRRERARLLSIARRSRRLRKRVMKQRDDARDGVLDLECREEKLKAHAEKLVHERNVLRAQLVVYSEVPRWGSKTGVA